MTLRILRYGIPAASAVFAAATFSACSNSSNNSTTDAGTGGSIATGGGGTSSGGGGTSSGGGGTSSGGGGTSSGGTSSGGTSSGGMSSGGGGTGGSTDAGLALGYICQAKAAQIDPGGDGAMNAACCGGIGACVLASSLPTTGAATSFGHDTCKKSSGADDLKCAPAPAGDAATAQAVKLGLYSGCTANIGGSKYEGRCVPGCFMEGNPQVGTLHSDGCDDNADGGGPLGLLCAPCYNPVDATDTGACRTAPGDAPTKPAPTPYAKCGAVKLDGGDDLPPGTCVPKSVALASGSAAAAALKQDDCATADQVCVPDLKANAVNGCFPKCNSGLSEPYTKGACVPFFIVRDVSPAGLALLKKGTCTAPDDLCAPCDSPTAPGTPSHSCE